MFNMTSAHPHVSRWLFRKMKHERRFKLFTFGGEVGGIEQMGKWCRISLNEFYLGANIWAGYVIHINGGKKHHFSCRYSRGHIIDLMVKSSAFATHIVSLVRPDKSVIIDYSQLLLGWIVLTTKGGSQTCVTNLIQYEILRFSASLVWIIFNVYNDTFKAYFTTILCRQKVGLYYRMVLNKQVGYLSLCTKLSLPRKTEPLRPFWKPIQ